jgi:hypothetical protein
MTSFTVTATLRSSSASHGFHGSRLQQEVCNPTPAMASPRVGATGGTTVRQDTVRRRRRRASALSPRRHLYRQLQGKIKEREQAGFTVHCPTTSSSQNSSSQTCSSKNACSQTCSSKNISRQTCSPCPCSRLLSPTSYYYYWHIVVANLKLTCCHLFR